jgi:ribose transport system substrate-binding protein
MDKKKIISDILVILIALALFILWHEKNFDERSVTVTSTHDYKIYLITMDKQDQHWYTLNQGAEDMATLLGINYVWDAPEIKDTMKQIEIIYKAVEDGANLILLAANDPGAVSNAIEDALAPFGVRITQKYLSPDRILDLVSNSE